MEILFIWGTKIKISFKEVNIFFPVIIGLLGMIEATIEDIAMTTVLRG
jgi:hypothetical protein